jgi:hypothetical protein
MTKDVAFYVDDEYTERHKRLGREAAVRGAIAAIAGLAASIHAGYPWCLMLSSDDIREIETHIVEVLARSNNL